MKEGIPDLPRIGIQRRILLLLADHIDHFEDYEVPEMLSQKGIGREMGLRQNHVSRALSELKDRGLVGSRTARIRGAGRRKKIYFLTERGILDNREFIINVQASRVPVRTSDGRLRSLPVPKAIELITRRDGERPSYYHFFSFFFDGSEVNLVKGSGSRSSGAPPVGRYFIGREEEMDLMKEALDDPSIPFISVISLAGMGKTTLISRVVDGSDSTVMSWSSMTEWTGPERMLGKWSRDLSAVGRRSLQDHLGRSSALDPEESVGKLLQDLEGMRAVFILDDLQRADPLVNELLSVLLERSHECKATFITGSRTRPSFYHKGDVTVKGKVLEIDLQGLDRNSSLELLERRGIPIGERERIAELARGHPLSLELCCSSSIDPMGVSREIEDYLGSELVSGLNRGEKEVLFLACAYEEPVVPDALLLFEGSDRSVLDELREKLLIRVYQDGRVDLHDLLKDNLRSWMGERKLSECMAKALEFLSRRGSEREILHYLALLERAGKEDDIKRLILDHGADLLEWNESRIGDIINSMDPSDLSNIDGLKLILLHVEMDILHGDLSNAGIKLETAMDMISALKDDGPFVQELSFRIFSLKAEVSRLEGKDREAISNHLENVRRIRKKGTMNSLGKALNNLAMAYRNSGELNRSKESLEGALKIFDERNDKRSTALVLSNLAEIHVLMGERDLARNCLKRIDKKVLEEGKVGSRIGLKSGRVRSMLRDHEEALKDMKRAYATSMNIDDRQGAATSMCGILDVNLKMGNQEDAISSLRNLIPLVKDSRSGEKWTVSIASSYLSNLIRLGSAHLHRDVLRGMEIMLVIKFERESHMSVVKELGVIRRKSGNPEVMERMLSTASRLLGEMDDIHASVVVSLWLCEDLLRNGKRKMAMRILKEVRRDASEIGFQRAVKKTDGLIEGAQFS